MHSTASAIYLSSQQSRFLHSSFRATKSPHQRLYRYLHFLCISKASPHFPRSATLGNTNIRSLYTTQTTVATQTPATMTSKSAQKLIPSDPVSSMVIRDITPNITTLSLPFLRFGLIKIGGRATLVKLATGNVAVFSPVALTDDVKTKVTSLGKLKYIVAPDVEHHIFVSPWSKEYPEAEIVGVEGLAEKREQDPATKGVKIHHTFTAANKATLKISPEFDEEFDYEYFHSHGNKELVFNHKPSRTLIQADLIFNLPATEQYSKSGQSATDGVATKIFNNLMNTRGDMIAQRRLLWYGPGSGDRKGFGESSKRVLGWDFDRMIPCHGDVVETGAKSILEKATLWFREGKK